MHREDEQAPVPLLSSEENRSSSSSDSLQVSVNMPSVEDSQAQTQVNVDVDVDVDLQTYEDQDGPFPLTEQERMRYIGTIRNKSRVLITVFVPITVALLICALLDSKKHCEKPLVWWGGAGVCLLSFCTFFQFVILQQTRNWDRIPFLLIRLNQLIYCSLFAWYVTGCVWVFTIVDKHGTCRITSPNIYRMALSIVIIGLILAGLTIFCCCFCLTHVTFQLYRAFVDFRKKQPKGATQKVIDKLVAEFWPVQNIEGEDALCAICLGEYEEKEKLRFLPCKHHFHAECVDTWLLKNASCPLCKYSILEPSSAQADNTTHSTPTNTGSPSSPSAPAPSTAVETSTSVSPAPLVELPSTSSSSSSTAEDWAITIAPTTSTTISTSS